MGQREGPEPEVGGGVRDGAQHVFDGVDGLVDHDLAEGLLLVGVGGGGGLGLGRALAEVRLLLHLDALAHAAVRLLRLEKVTQGQLEGPSREGKVNFYNRYYIPRASFLPRTRHYMMNENEL